jgi:putative ABC transport system substrate-binding protein
VEGRTIRIEYRWAEGHLERYAEITAEFVRSNVNVIVTGGAGALAAKQATSVIPIVSALTGDPIGTGLVANLARPGGNITGLSYQSSDLAGKRIDLLRAAIPQLRRVGVLGNSSNPTVALEMREVGAGGQKLGLEVIPLVISRAEDIADAFKSVKDRVDALYVCVDGLVNANRVKIIRSALDLRLPSIYGTRDYAVDGGLMSYGPDFPDLFRRAAEVVDKILRGANPGEMPFEQPTKYDFVINLTTATSLGLVIPPSLLSLAELID